MKVDRGIGAVQAKVTGVSGQKLSNIWQLVVNSKANRPVSKRPHQCTALQMVDLATKRLAHYLKGHAAICLAFKKKTTT